MRIRKQILIASLTIVGAVVGIAAPASAADTAVTFELTGGALTLDVVAGAKVLTPEASGVAVNDITGSLTAVTVTDARGGTLGWVASAASTTFTGPGSVSTDVKYTNGEVVETGTNTVEPAVAKSIASVTSVATATFVSGNNTASWTPTLTVSLPAGALAGTYSGTVTTSLV